MNGIHDCGGVDGLGSVSIEKDEPVFHAGWERRIFGLNWAIGMNGWWNQDEYRHAMEDRPVMDYLRDSYYEKWLFGLERLLVEKGVFTREDLLAARKIETQRLPAGAEPAMTVEKVPVIVRDGFSYRRNEAAAPRFAVGGQVRTRNINIEGHTRLPRYARDKIGVIVEDRGVFSFNDSAANEGDERPQHVYSVRFTAREVWGENANPKDTLCLDLWDEHMDLVPEDTSK